MSVLHRLSLAHKFLILGLIFLLMLLLPTGIYFSRSFQELDAALLEARSAASVVALNKVVQLTQTHRGLSAGALNGNETLAARRPDMRDKVVQAVAVFDREIKAAGAPQKVLAPWAALQQRWTALEQQVASGQIKAAESTRLHTQLVTDLLTENEEVLSTFGLSLDPESDHYYLIQAALVNLPWLAENLGIMRAQGAAFLTQGALPPEGRATL
jgi:hypothetical protein